MATVFLSLGSNIERKKNITAALDRLNCLFGNLNISSVYESEPVGFSGDCFFNLVVGIETEVSLQELSHEVKKIEDENGRLRTGPRFSARTLDIDIITYGLLHGVHSDIKLPRPELYYNAFVLWPMAELMPNMVDIQTGQTYQTLWQRMSESNTQKLWPVEFTWSGQRISESV